MGWFDFLLGKSPRNAGENSLTGTSHQPRCAHYRFAHYALRMIAFDRPLTFFGALASPEAHEFLAAIFKMVEEDCCQEREPPDFRPTDIVIECGRILNHPLVVLELPPPRAVTEAYMVGVVLMIDVESDEPPPEKPDLRYFTLEHSFQDNGQPTAILCAWTESMHSQLGQSMEPSRDAFVQAIMATMQ